MEPVLSFHIDSALAEADSAVRAALQRHGFGILTEVDVTAVLRARLGVETKPYRILGACNPGIAHLAMEADPRVGAFLPCGIALYEEPPGTTTAVLQNPGMISAAFAADGLAGAAAEALEKLSAALGEVGTPA